MDRTREVLTKAIEKLEELKSCNIQDIEIEDMDRAYGNDNVKRRKIYITYTEKVSLRVEEKCSGCSCNK